MRTEIEIEKDLERVTLGPWQWRVNATSKKVSLFGAKSNLVFDTHRWGMSGACLRFNVEGLMQKAQDISIPFPGREHHAAYEQYPNHPDALFISRAREDMVILLNRIKGLKEQQSQANIQYHVGEWLDVTFSNVDHNHRKLIKFKEEVKEFLDEPCKEEAADVFIALLGYAHRENFDLIEEAYKKLHIVKNRDQVARDAAKYSSKTIDEAESDGSLHPVFAQDARDLGYTNYDNYLDEECK